MRTWFAREPRAECAEGVAREAEAEEVEVPLRRDEDADLALVVLGLEVLLGW